MARDYVCLYHSYLDAVQALGDAERGRLFTAMLEYSLTGATGHLSGNERFIFPMVKAQIDRDKEKYDAKCSRNRENGKMGANASERQRTPANAPQGKGKDKGKDKGKEEGKGEGDPLTGNNTRFAPPSLSDVADYCRERRNGVDPERFVDFYAAKGWKVGNQPMKDWKAAVRTWEKRDNRSAEKSGNVFLDIAREEGIL